MWMAGGGPSSPNNTRTELWHRNQKVSQAQPASWCDTLQAKEGTYSGRSRNRCRLQTIGHSTAKTGTKLAGSPLVGERGAVPTKDAAEGTVVVRYMYILHTLYMVDSRMLGCHARKMRCGSHAALLTDAFFLSFSIVCCDEQEGCRR